MKTIKWDSLRKLTPKQWCGVGLIVLLAFLLGRQYLPMLELPTKGRLEREQALLKSKINDLAVQRKMSEDFLREVDALRGRMSMFWIRLRVGMPVEQEVLDEFNGVVRMSSINIQNKEAKLIKNTNSTYIQEVEIRLEMRGITMREFVRFMKQLSMNRRKFYWQQCRIEPDNLQNPTGIKVSARLRAYVLTDDGSNLLASGTVVLPEGNGKQKADASRKNGSRNTRKGKKGGR